MGDGERRGRGARRLVVTGNARKSFWTRPLVQFGGCVFFAAFLPFVVRSLTLDVDAQGTLQQTFVGCVFAIAVAIAGDTDSFLEPAPAWAGTD